MPIFDIMCSLPLLAVVILIGCIPFSCRAYQEEHARLMAECRADGLKEYECVSMLRGRGRR